MRILKSRKTTKRWTWITMLLIGMVSVGISSCGDDDDNNNVTPEPEEPEEVESAWIYGFRLPTPQGRVYYMAAAEEVPSQVDISQVVEVGLNVRLYSYNGHPYTWNENAATMTKWDVDRTTLELSVSGVLSLGGSGVSGFVERPIFFSETRAFTIQLEEQLIVEWNPTSMEINQVFNIPSLPDVGNDNLQWYTQTFRFVTSDGKILMNIVKRTPDNCCGSSELSTNGAIMAVFDPEIGSIQYIEDERTYCGDKILQDPIDGSLYLPSSGENSFLDPYFDTSGLPPRFSVLKLNADGTFDPDFFVDLTDIIDISFYAISTYVYDGNLVCTYIDQADHSHAASYDDRFTNLGDNRRTVIIDLETGDLTTFDSFNNLGYGGGTLLNIVDGEVSYYATFGGEGGGLLRLIGTDDFTVLSTTPSGGSFQVFDRLW
ncbi:MAG: hypothetical protein ACFB15_28235 [Cyclobacteriaceae bacterium]